MAKVSPTLDVASYGAAGDTAGALRTSARRTALAADVTADHARAPRFRLRRRLPRAMLQPSMKLVGLVQIGTGLASLWALLFLDVLWGWWALALFGYFMYGCVGLTAGFHRYFSHRSYAAPRWAQIMFSVLGVMGFIGSAPAWTVVHRLHHVFSDKDGDPHPRHRDGWRTMFVGGYTAAPQPWAMRRELRKDPFAAWVHRHFLPLALAWPALLLSIDLQLFLFLWVVPVALTLWAGGLTTYVTHGWGSRPHATKDNSRNNALIALLAWGEGWHNNHHAHPRRPLFAERWWQWDPGGLVALGLARLASKMPAKGTMLEGARHG